MEQSTCGSTRGIRLDPVMNDTGTVRMTSGLVRSGSPDHAVAAA